MNFRFNFYYRRKLLLICFLEAFTAIIWMILAIMLKGESHSKSLYNFLVLLSIIDFIGLIFEIYLLITSYSNCKNKMKGEIIKIEIKSLLCRKEIVVVLSYIDSRGNKRIINSEPFYTIETIKFNPESFFYSYVNKSKPVQLYFYKNKYNKALIEGLVF